MQRFIFPFVFCCGLFISTSGEAAYVFKNGQFVNAEESPTLSVEEHYRLGMKAMEAGDWYESCHQFFIVSSHFPASEFYSDSLYFQGVSYYYQEEYDFANDALNAYLKCQNNPKHFEEAIGYKFVIAEKFKGGARRRFLGTKKLPKWAPGRSMAGTIYDEVICSLPCHEYAARALFAKGELCREDQEYREAVESLQTLIRRFPKHELTPESYLVINDIYLEQSELEFQNPDLLALAQINLKRFKLDFPRDERVGIAEAKVSMIREVYARGLFETGQFYERTCRPTASIIYYMKAIRQFPETDIAKICRNRLMTLQPEAVEFADSLAVQQAP